MNRITEIKDNLIGGESPDDMMLEILEVLTETELVPEPGKYYTFVYQPKTPNVEYDEFPLVAVTSIFQWGFRGLNFHWGQIRQYTWEEVIGQLHIVTNEEIQSLRGIPYQKMRLNN
tara:strand:- start:2368 stop:2715 length:348 start_codon:yes stop_codon:yes gene_type:complete